MKPPLVSVIIPAYNAAKTLKATVESVFEQTFEDFEIIIVNDGSTDETLALAESIAGTDERVRIISQPNRGVASARNNGIRAAAGEYVALLDADDLWVQHKLERQIEVLTKSVGEEVFAVQSGALFVNDNLEVISVRPCEPSKDALLETLLFQNMPNNMSTLVIKRSKFDEMGYFDTELEILEEWDMAIKAARFCNLKSIEEPLSLYRVYEGNRSRNLEIHIQPGFLVLKRLFEDPSLPKNIKRRKRLIYAHFYTMLSGGCFKINNIKGCVRWAAKAVMTHPGALGYILAMPFRRIHRYFSRRNNSTQTHLIQQKS